METSSWVKGGRKLEVSNLNFTFDTQANFTFFLEKKHEQENNYILKFWLKNNLFFVENNTIMHFVNFCFTYRCFFHNRYFLTAAKSNSCLKSVWPFDDLPQRRSEFWVLQGQAINRPKKKPRKMCVEIFGKQQNEKNAFRKALMV